MSNICKNCRFWIPHENPAFKGECDKRDDSQMEVNVWAADDSGLTYMVLTAPSFGCTLFEAGQHYSLRDYDDDVLDGED